MHVALKYLKTKETEMLVCPVNDNIFQVMREKYKCVNNDTGITNQSHHKKIILP